jgi:uncharacterized protein
VLILLPPSEGKASPTRGAALDLDGMSLPRLRPTRERVLDELVRLCRDDEDTAASALGLGPKQRMDIDVDARLRTAPCAPAMRVYSGVLYDSLDYATLTGRARRRANQHVLISSGLWGLIRPTDRIPAYRLSGAVTLPGLGTLASVWRGPVSTELSDATSLIVDLRSSTYQALGPVPAGARSVAVRVLQERDGRRTVVSHSNKATKGRIVRALLEAPRLPSDTRGLLSSLSSSGYAVEESGDERAPVVDVIVAEP